MDKQTFKVMSFYIWTISILSITLSLIAPLLASQVVLFMLIGSGLVLWTVVALMRKFDGE
jgi:hypothetical protein